MKRSIFVLAFAILCVVILGACTLGQPARGSGGITGVSVSGTSITGNKLIGASTALTLTAGQIITPTYTTYVLSSSGAVSMTLGGSCTTGQLLYLYGDDNNTITVNDTNIYTTDGNPATLGQFDVVGWVCNTNKWYHLFKSANS